jgi:hypothetical protein
MQAHAKRGDSTLQENTAEAGFRLGFVAHKYGVR